jgi:hypothetical protein
MAQVTLTDENNIGNVIQELLIDLPSYNCSVQELIAARVTKEVELYNDKSAEIYQNGLIKPTFFEQNLNKDRLINKLKRDKVDAEKQLYVALDAFTKNGFFILVDDHQVETLDSKLQLSRTSKVSFIKLTALVGG